MLFGPVSNALFKISPMINLLKKTNKNYIFVEIQNFKIMRRKAFVYNKIMYPDFFNNFKEIF